MGLVSSIMTILGILSLVYFIVCICCAGLSSTFSFIWLAAAALCFCISKGIGYMNRQDIHVPVFGKVVILLVLSVAILVFGYVEGLILSSSNDMPKEEVQYVVVLGARVNGTRVSRSLSMRLNAAYKYAEKYPNTTVIVSGGKGPGEEVTEAQAMKDYLVEKGLKEERIIMEDASTNTDENIQFTRAIIKDDSASVAIVTNSFHLYRGKQIAKKQGLSNVSGIAASTHPVLALNYYVREGLAVIQYKLSGRI